MKKILLALAASTLLGGAAQAVTFDGDASFSPAINSVNPGLQAKANVISNSGPQGFTSIDLDFDLDLGDTFTTDLFVVRTLQTIFTAGDDDLEKDFGLVFNFVQGSATVTGKTYAVNDGVNVFGVIKFDGPGIIALGNAQALLITLANTVFNKGAGVFTPGKSNGARVSATFEVAAVPLPATLPLALGAFGAMAFVARRRKASAQA